MYVFMYVCEACNAGWGAGAAYMADPGAPPSRSPAPRAGTSGCRARPCLSTRRQRPPLRWGVQARRWPAVAARLREPTDMAQCQPAMPNPTPSFRNRLQGSRVLLTVVEESRRHVVVGI